MKMVLLIVCLLAAIQDLWIRAVPNSYLSLSLIFCTLFSLISGQMVLKGFGIGICRSVCIFFLLYFPWKKRMLGAGDVKLCMLLALFIPLVEMGWIALAAIWCAALLGCVHLSMTGKLRERFLYFAEWMKAWLKTGVCPPYMSREDFSGENTIPLSAAICAGYVIIMILRW